MWDYEEMQRRRAEEALSAKRELMERNGTPGDHDVPPRLVSPFMYGLVDSFIHLIAQVERGEIGGALDGATPEEEVDDVQEA